MPSVSPAQARLMALVAHGGRPRAGGGPSQAVAQEFNDADAGGPMLSAPRPQGTPMPPNATPAMARQRALAMALRSRGR